MTCLMALSLPAASIAWKTSRRAHRSWAKRSSWYSASASRARASACWARGLSSSFSPPVSAGSQCLSRKSSPSVTQYGSQNFRHWRAISLNFMVVCPVMQSSSRRRCQPSCNFILTRAPATLRRLANQEHDGTPVPPAQFLNRELSWLEFNQRVLDEALDKKNPLLERVKFFCITSSNLDEFFEVRVAGIKQQIESGVIERSADGLTASETFRAVHRRVRRMVEDQYACWRDQLRPGLARHGIRFLAMKDLARTDLEWLERFYHAEVRPVLTPLAIDPTHPFPQILNKSLNMI